MTFHKKRCMSLVLYTTSTLPNNFDQNFVSDQTAITFMNHNKKLILQWFSIVSLSKNTRKRNNIRSLRCNLLLTQISLHSEGAFWSWKNSRDEWKFATHEPRTHTISSMTPSFGSAKSLLFFEVRVTAMDVTLVGCLPTSIGRSLTNHFGRNVNIFWIGFRFDSKTCSPIILGTYEPR